MGGMATETNQQKRSTDFNTNTNDYLKSSSNSNHTSSQTTINNKSLLNEAPLSKSLTPQPPIENINRNKIDTNISSSPDISPSNELIENDKPHEIDYAEQMRIKRNTAVKQAAAKKKAENIVIEKNRAQAVKDEERQHKKEKADAAFIATEPPITSPTKIPIKTELTSIEKDSKTSTKKTKSAISNISWPETRMGDIHKSVDFLQNNSDIKGKLDFDLQDAQENPNQGIPYLKATLEEYKRRDPIAAHDFQRDLLTLAQSKGQNINTYLNDNESNEPSKNIGDLKNESTELDEMPQTFTYQKYSPRGGDPFVEIDFPSRPADTIDGNQKNYGNMDIILNNKKGAIKSQWFKAAYEVTSANAIGVAENAATGALTDQIDKDYLNFIHHNLAPINHDNFLKLYSGEEIQGLEGLRGKELDYALVELEQNHVERLTKEYYGEHPYSYKSQTMNNLSDDTDPDGFWKSLLYGELGNGYVDDAIDTSFGNSQYDQSSLEDRITLGKTIIDQIYEERKAQ